MSKPQSKIIFILSSVSQPRCIKRIKSFIMKGYDVEIYGFDRGKYSQNATIDGKRINIVGTKKDGSGYFEKLIQTFKAISKIIRHHKSPHNVFYVFGIYQAIFMTFFDKKYIYEISDILYGYSKFDKLRSLFKKIDQFLIKKSTLTVFTSAGFTHFFFTEKPANIIIQPNKINPSFRNNIRPSLCTPQDSKRLTYSYVGAFRSPNTIFRFAQIIGEYYPNHYFNFYGESALSNEAINIADKYSNVSFFGSYKNPDDLFDIYNSIHLVIACYDTSDLNERILEPNKLYEALYFKKPIVVSKNTYLADRVKHFGCGFAIDASSDQSIIAFIESLSIEKIKEVEENILKVSLDEIIDDNAVKIINYLENKL